ncbi:glutamate 5-kinase [Halodesulfovibrio sp. MK-HDV]|jgi:glutamate 5-kinase|uniref:glutamate 5-kinase n=1 Tax=Halodesulfovibrio sp. MK-HDV TaxID=2599925 RepID=UPI001368B0F4|nr:glutamate 5-kinase [Halodesulfovibrio sp. MK-HDV]KAF1076867.1 Glutamate 5-kinase [Halodesulfovibrio sp. MK-HDV]
MDWEQEREQVLNRAKCVVVKVGSAVLTSGLGVDLTVIKNLTRQLAQLHDRGTQVVLVSSGAVAAGRTVLKTCCEIKGVPDKQAAAAVGQGRLMHFYNEEFTANGKMSAQVLLTRDDLKDRNRLLNARNTFASLLGWRAIPIVNANDTVATAELAFTDNDNLASLLLNVVNADLYINLTSAKGVYTSNPDGDPNAKPIEVIEDIQSLDLEVMCGGKTTVGTGGMLSKLTAAGRAAQLGVPTLIISGLQKDAIVRAFSGERMGTWVCPDTKKVSSRKFWLAYHSDPEGSVVVDAGAEKALVERGKSLLPAGITRVDGVFSQGALVRVVSENDVVIGMGLTNYASGDLKKVLRKHSDELEAIMGASCYTEAIHRDNLLMDAVV